MSSLTWTVATDKLSASGVLYLRRRYSLDALEVGAKKGEVCEVFLSLVDDGEDATHFPSYRKAKKAAKKAALTYRELLFEVHASP